MAPRDIQYLALTLKNRRTSLQLSARETARLADIDSSTYLRLEQGKIANPRPESLAAIARALQMTASDLFAIAHWLPAQELPEFGPYLRGKYRDIPEAALQEVEDCMAQIWRRYDCPLKDQRVGAFDPSKRHVNDK